jgi:ATP-dependent RNA helicase RhlE
MHSVNFADLSLAAPLQRALAEKGYTVPSPIQAQAIPVILEGRDLLACAQTGTGKTAAFALPILHQMAENPRKTFRRGVRCLILTPTRELAVQVMESFATYGKYIDLKFGMVFGGVSEKPQIKALYSGLDILVATTGRLLDLHQQGHIDLSQVDTLILDEADRMLDMGFIRDIRKIAALVPKQRHTLFFSATMAPEVTQLANSLLNKPADIRITPESTTAEKIDQHVLFVDKRNKPKLLIDLVGTHAANNKGELSLVFSRTKHGARRLAEQLNKAGIEADAIHGNKSQAARQKTLNRFRDGDLPVLVATDVAARGIDVKNITLVINFDLPMEPEAYIHRIGRTARAGESGQALTLCCDDELALLRAVERLIKIKVPILESHDHHCPVITELYTSGAKTKTVNPQQNRGNSGRSNGGGRSNSNRGRSNSGPRTGGSGSGFAGPGGQSAPRSSSHGRGAQRARNR